MSKDPSTDPDRTDSLASVGAEASSQLSHDAPVIRKQSAQIIDAVLSGTAPEQASARDRLREHLAAHPGRPDIALAEHLSADAGSQAFAKHLKENYIDKGKLGVSSGEGFYTY